MERWRDIDGFDGVYQVSNLGRVRKVKRTGTHGPRMMASRVGSRGYVTVSLKPLTARQRPYLVHRLVAEAFHGAPPSPKHQCNHLDGNKTNNCTTNLEWVTCSQNHLHAHRKLGRTSVSPGVKGSEHGCAVLNEEAVREIRVALKQNPKPTHASLATAYDVSQWTIRDIAQGKSWKHVVV
jgi:NUMOD4 motif/HNH endonuclease